MCLCIITEYLDLRLEVHWIFVHLSDSVFLSVTILPVEDLLQQLLRRLWHRLYFGDRSSDWSFFVQTKISVQRPHVRFHYLLYLLYFSFFYSLVLFPLSSRSSSSLSSFYHRHFLYFFFFFFLPFNITVIPWVETKRVPVVTRCQFWHPWVRLFLLLFWHPYVYQSIYRYLS